MIKDFIRGFIFVFIMLMLYLIIANFILVFTAMDLGLYENLPLFMTIAVLVNIAPFVILTLVDRKRKKKMRKEIDEFVKHGTQATARVTEVKDTGITLNNDPVVQITLMVNPDMAGAFNHTTEVPVSRVKIPRAGDMVRVLYDPKDLSRFSIED